jgi:hypothetical protein
MTLILSGTDGLSDVDGSAATPAIRGTDANTGIFFPAADTIAFAEGGVESMRIDASGNMGVGTTPSAWGSTTKAVQLPNGCAIANLGAGDVVVTQNAYFDNPNFKYASTTGVGSSVYRQIDGTHRWSYAASGTAGNNITFTEAMRIDTSGNVGIGTSSPTDTGGYGKALDVQGSGGSAVYVRSTTSPSTNYGYVGFTGGSSNLDIWNNPAGNIRFYNNNAERMRIDSSGSLLVGTTSNGGSEKAIFAYADASNNGVGIRETSDASNTTFLAFRASNSALCGRVTRVGTTNAVAYNTSSDYRLKESVQPMTGALTKIALLKPCTYKWKADGSDGQGFIAHELQAVVPDAVVGAKDAVDADGNIIPQGIDTSFLVATLTAAIQEQQAIITQLQADVASLKGTP